MELEHLAGRVAALELVDELRVKVDDAEDAEQPGDCDEHPCGQGACGRDRCARRLQCRFWLRHGTPPSAIRRHGASCRWARVEPPGALRRDAARTAMPGAGA